MKSNGFTLVELTVVLLIMAIAAGAAVLRLDSPAARARMEDVVSEITNCDALVRNYAREHNRRVCLVVDLSENRLKCMDEQKEKRLGAEVKLPSRFSISRVLIGRMDINSGTTTINFTRKGLTPSYAVLLEGKKTQGRWLFVSGLTGQIVEFDREEDVREIFTQLQKGPDAG